MKAWKELIDPGVHLRIAAECFSIEPGSLVKHGGFENVVYTGKRDGKEVILRVSHTDHRSIAVAESELHWVQDLASRGVPVSRPLPSVSGKLLEAIPTDRGQLLLSLWEKAPGRHVNPLDPAWGPALFRHWGEVTGMLHAAAQEYQLPAGMTCRPDMTGLNIHPGDAGPLNPAKEFLFRKYKEVTDHTRGLPRTPGNFGLSHRDLHAWNFFVDDGRITVFDFDDCGYDYFAHDIAMAVYYAVDFMHRTAAASTVDEVSARAERFLEAFLKGYRHHYDLSVEDLSTIPLFAERRRIELTLLTYDPWSHDNARPDQKAWLERNLRDIEGNVPCLRIDF